jgi:hypothetical protein
MGRIGMKWVIALFIALFSIPVAQVAADAWNGRPGPRLSVTQSQTRFQMQSHGAGNDFAVTRHHLNRLYDPFSPWLPTRAKTG